MTNSKDTAMICGLLICAAFTFGWWFGGWQVYRNWKKLAALSAKSLACADFWQKEFLNLLGKLEPMRMEAPVPPQYAKDSVCREIQEIMETYREQAASSYGVDTPGGLEHMGDVWRLLGQWDQALSGTVPSKACRNPNHALVDGTPSPHEIGPSCMAEQSKAPEPANPVNHEWARNVIDACTSGNSHGNHAGDQVLCHRVAFQINKHFGLENRRWNTDGDPERDADFIDPYPHGDYFEEVKRHHAGAALSSPSPAIDPCQICICGHNRAQHDRDKDPYLCRAAVERGTYVQMCNCMDFEPSPSPATDKEK